MSIIPEQTTDSDLDDTQGVELDLESLFNKFILPIDRMRSFSAPTMVHRPTVKDDETLVNDVANSSDTDPTRPQESRTHAFYRMIGFPVINENLEFYNPGFNPVLKSDERRKNYDISTKISQAVRTTHSLRETDVRTRAAIFERVSIDAAVYAISMGVPAGIKPFLQMDAAEGFDFINKEDKQKFSKGIRREFVKRRYKKRSGEEIVNFFDSGSHILRPFTVDPNIVDTVTSFSNETRHVAAPFLRKKEDTGIERNIFAKRPGIEFILWLRLREQDSRSISEQIASSINKEQDLEGLSIVEVTQVVNTLLNEEDIQESDITERLKNVNNLEFINLNKLVKTIKGVINILVQSVDNIRDLSRKIKWTPLPSEDGPEGGSSSTNLIVPKQRTPLEKRFINLRTRAIANNSTGSFSDADSLSFDDLQSSDFHLSQYESLEKTFSNEIDDIVEKIEDLQAKGSDSLAAIEIITGEISGLGLIDVLAIYTALWAVDIRVLLSMLDESSFNRLYSFKELRSVQVEERRNSGPHMGILEAVQTFERQVINILSYSDRVFEQNLGAPSNSEGGNVPKVDLGS